MDPTPSVIEEAIDGYGVKYIMQAMDRLTHRFGKDEHGGCWVWCGTTKSSGSGGSYKSGRLSFTLRGRKAFVLVHRIALRLSIGHPLIGLALHKCGNSLCVNPDHLYEGTTADNARDTVFQSGRMTDEKKREIALSRIGGVE